MLELSHTCNMLPSYGAQDLRELLGELLHVYCCHSYKSSRSKLTSIFVSF